MLCRPDWAHTHRDLPTSACAGIKDVPNHSRQTTAFMNNILLAYAIAFIYVLSMAALELHPQFVVDRNYIFVKSLQLPIWHFIEMELWPLVWSVSCGWPV
jgi:hypothetical protein